MTSKYQLFSRRKKNDFAREATPDGDEIFIKLLVDRLDLMNMKDLGWGRGGSLQLRSGDALICSNHSCRDPSGRHDSRSVFLYKMLPKWSRIPIQQGRSPKGVFCGSIRTDGQGTHIYGKLAAPSASLLEWGKSIASL